MQQLWTEVHAMGALVWIELAKRCGEWGLSLEEIERSNNLLWLEECVMRLICDYSDHMFGWSLIDLIHGWGFGIAVSCMWDRKCKIRSVPGCVWFVSSGWVTHDFIQCCDEVWKRSQWIAREISEGDYVVWGLMSVGYSNGFDACTPARDSAFFITRSSL